MMHSIHRSLGAAGAFGLGMLAMYVFDPDRGRRRRRIAADRVRGAGAQLGDAVRVAVRDAANRGRGTAAELKARLRHEDVSGRTLEERVRARIGRAISNPHAIEVHAHDDGQVVLGGPLLRSELNELLAAVWSVRGVLGVENRLELHDEPGRVPGLQGAHARSDEDELDREWPPSLRALAAAAGATAAIAGFALRRPLGLVATLAGGALLARSVANRSLREVAGLDGPHSVHVRKEMFIAAPAERLFEFWCNPERFPEFMRNVVEVRPLGEGLWHWKVAGPLGTVVEWDSEIVEREENRRLAWRTLTESAVDHEGRIDFEPAEGGTRLRLSMSYAPAAGVLGHAVARLFGKDAKTEIDQDLMRIKAFLETGSRAHDAAANREGSGEAVRSVH